MDTIFALASAPGKSGVAVLRISGSRAFHAGRVLAGGLPDAQRTSLRKLRDSDGSVIDEALVLAFESPNSFTGEDCVEFQTHGSPAIIAALMNELSALPGLRLAQPGEFTRRALENNRMDLAQVEGLADLIEAETEAQRKQALRTFSGELGQKVELWRRDLVRAMALLEVTIDFADEEVPEDVYPEVQELLGRVSQNLAAESAGTHAAERIRHGFEVAILGAPNVGKSSLLNRLAGREAAITSSIAGTTRDVVEVRLDLDGLPVTVLDTAGLRETQDEIEQIGISRAMARAESADLRIILIEDGRLPSGLGVADDDILVQAKSDILPSSSEFAISSVTGRGIDRLVKAVSHRLSLRAASAGTATHVRHRLAISSAVESLDLAKTKISEGFPVELVIEDLRQALVDLESLIGRVGVEQVLDEIFANFCLGK